MGIVTFFGTKKVTIQNVVRSDEMLRDVAKRAK